MGTTKRGQAGEGWISEYQTKAGPRFLIKYPVLQEDGTKRVVLERGFRTKREAAAALRAEIRKTETGEWVHTDDGHWQRAFDAQRALARIERWASSIC